MEWLAIFLGPAVSVAVVTWILKLYRDHRAQQRKILNVIRSLLAEIEINLEAQSELFQKGTDLEEIFARIDSDPGYVPMIFSDRSPNPLFEELKGELVLLPDDVLKPVIAYYKEDSFANSVIEDFRAKRFAALEPDRKKNALKLLWEQVERTSRAATEAIERLGSHLDRT